MKSRASSKCLQKVTNKDWRQSFQELDRITALVPGKPEVVLFSFSLTSAIRFLRAYGVHIAMYSRACAVALSAISGHEHVKIHSTNRLELFFAKNRSKKHQIFEKWDHFENRPSCKGYSPCKILTLCQKLKLQKTCQNQFYKSFRVVLCKKTAPKNTKYLRIESVFRNGYHAKAFAKSLLWFKN